MYCTKCGKYIDYDALVCNECKQAEQEANAQVQQDFGFEQPVNDFSQPYLHEESFEDNNASTFNQQAGVETPVAPITTQPTNQQAGSVMTGFGKALTGAIFAFIATIFLSIASSVDADALIICCVFCIATCIPAIILGAQSMKCFFRENAKGNKKPIPALVLGIYALAIGASLLTLALFLLMLV